MMKYILHVRLNNIIENVLYYFNSINIMKQLLALPLIGHRFSNLVLTTNRQMCSELLNYNRSYYRNIDILENLYTYTVTVDPAEAGHWLIGSTI